MDEKTMVLRRELMHIRKSIIESLSATEPVLVADKQPVITGVTYGTRVGEFFWDVEMIDLSEQWADENGDDDLERLDGEGATYLIGDWIKGQDGKYSPTGIIGKCGFSAIYDSNDNYIQVVQSRWVARCALCSPCFPNQGDMESAGEHWTFMLPPVLMYVETEEVYEL